MKLIAYGIQLLNLKLELKNMRKYVPRLKVKVSESKAALSMSMCLCRMSETSEPGRNAPTCHTAVTGDLAATKTTRVPDE